ncbi:unnamed protein product [Schistosoma turkestanicum]|nr:unnamed protein product [Schistosoma turkestanicum]
MLVEIVFVLFLFDKSISKTSTNVLIYEIKQNEHDHKYDLPINTIEVRFSCSFGTKWFIPSTVPFKVKPMVEVNHAKNQSTLLIRLPVDDNNLRANFRGLYQCCQSSNDHDIGIINWFPDEPSCCPCCPWYEQNQCLFKHHELINSSNVLVKLKNTSSHCGSVFLYTNSINMDSVRLDVIRDQPMLIPCPGLNSTFKEDASIFHIDYQLTPHQSSRQIWYPFKPSERNRLHSIVYYYDNRFGVCLLKSQFPRIMLFMLCNYQQIHQQRIIQPIWPMPSPVIAPTMHLYLQSVNKSEHTTYKLFNTKNHSQSFLQNINWFVKYSNEILTFRVKQETTLLSLTCIGSYTQKYIVHKPIGKLCFRWKTLNQNDEQLSNISKLQEHYQLDDQSIWERTECLTTHQTFHRLSILYAFSKYDLKLPGNSNETHQPANNTFILCEVTTPDRIAPRSRRIIQIVKTANHLSNKFHINFQCKCQILNDNRSLSNENSTLSLLIKNNTLDLNISFWTEHETDAQPFCTPIKHDLDSSDQMMKEIQLNLIRTKDNWKCILRVKLNSSSQTINLSIGYGQMKRTLQLFIVKSILELSRTVENLQSQITQQYSIHCVPNDIERNIARRLGYNYPNNVTWFISVDNHTRNYTTYNKTLEHIFKLIPFYDRSDYPEIVLNKTEKLWEEINKITHLRNLYLNYWPEKLCVKCTSVYEVGMFVHGQEICARFNDFNVVDLFNNTGNDYRIQGIKKKRQLYFVIEINNSSQFYEVNSQITNNRQISLVQGTSIKLECIRKLQTKPKQLQPNEWPELSMMNTLNHTDDHNTPHNTFWILSPYSLKIRKLIHFNNQLIQFKCSYENEQFSLGIHSFKQTRPEILKPIENVQLIRLNSQQHNILLLNHSNPIDNLTKTHIELICQATGSPKPTIQWMKAVYNQNESFTKWEIIHTCLQDENKLQFFNTTNFNTNHQQIQTCTYNLSTLLLISKYTLNQSHYQCLAKNTVGYTFKQIKLLYLDTTYINLNETINLQLLMKNTISWLCLILLPIIFILIIFGIILWFYYRIRYKNQYSSDISLPNVLYKTIYNHFHAYQYKSSSSSLLSAYSKDYKSAEQVLSELLGFTTINNTTMNKGNDITTVTTTTTSATTTNTTNTNTNSTTTTTNNSINQINRWMIPRKFIKRSNYSLGSGHYGSVYKAWLHCSFMKETDPVTNRFNDILLKEDTDNYIVAMKASSSSSSSMIERSPIHNHTNTNNSHITDNNHLVCLKNEIRILSNLTNCDNIIRMIGIMIESKPKRNKHQLDGINLILEYCQYKSLAHFIRCHSHQLIDSLMNYEEVQASKFPIMNSRHDEMKSDEYRLTVKELYRFAYGIICGIVYLMKNYVIHRDLATRNILINHNYIPKISDFGLAVQLTPMNGMTNDAIYNIDSELNENQLVDEYYRVLTPRKKLPLRILPPEALLQHTFYFNSDIWQYGLLLWELFHLEKREPFQEIKTFQQLVNLLAEHNLNNNNNNNNNNNSTNCNAKISRHMLKIKTTYQQSIPPSTLDRPLLVSDELWEIMCQMWSYNPHQRPTAVQIHDKLKCLLEDTGKVSDCIDFQYKCHGHEHHLHHHHHHHHVQHQHHHRCTYRNCKFLSETSSTEEVSNHMVHSYENTIQSI